MNKKKKELDEKYHEELWGRIAALELEKVNEDEIKISFPCPMHRVKETTSVVKAVEAILSYLGLELGREPEVIVIKKK